MKTHIYDLKFNDAEGHEHAMGAYEGKVILIINMPAESQHTEQLEELDYLHRKYEDIGLKVLGFPSDDFERKITVQNPLGTEKDDRIQNYDPSFPVMEKVHVRGRGIHPLFQYLTEGKSALFTNKVKWDYTKFIISREGRVVSRHSPRVPPVQLEEEIQDLLSG